MLWIKRNLFLALGGLVALGALGFGGFYLWKNVSENKKVETQLEEKKAGLQKLYNADPFPSTNNIASARDELKKAQAAMRKIKEYFTPLPYEKVTGQAFKTLLDTTLYELRDKAQQTSVLLPSKTYAFSFSAQKDKFIFAEGSFPALSEQLAEVRAICTILFEAKINRLINVRRTRVTTDDPPGSSDYLELRAESNELTGTLASPYQIEFQSFSPELASVLGSFYKSTNGFLVKAIQVEPVTESGIVGGPGPMATAPGTPANVPQPPAQPPPQPRVPPPAVPVPRVPPTGAPPAQPGPAIVKPPGPVAPAAEGIKTVLNEKLLKITFLIDVIKPSK